MKEIWIVDGKTYLDRDGIVIAIATKEEIDDAVKAGRVVTSN